MHQKHMQRRLANVKAVVDSSPPAFADKKQRDAKGKQLREGHFTVGDVGERMCVCVCVCVCARERETERDRERERADGCRP